MRYIIGVDSGGTSTKATAYDKDGKTLRTVQTGFGNPLIDRGKAVRHLEEAVEAIFQELPQEECTQIVFGIAGLDSGDFRTDLEEHFIKYPMPIHFLNDAWLAYFAALQNSDGILVISGTGSIAIGMKDGQKYRSGGWGNLLGDEGSAYAIAHQMIKNVLVAYDTGTSASVLNKTLLEFFNTESIFEIVQYVYQHKKDEIAALAKIVVAVADQGDEEAVMILEQAGHQLALLVKRLITQMSAQNHVKVAVSGSVLKNNAIVFERFSKDLKESYLTVELIHTKESNTIGAFYYSRILENEDQFMS